MYCTDATTKKTAKSPVMKSLPQSILVGKIIRSEWKINDNQKY